MAKINFQAMAMDGAALAAGTAASGFIIKMVSKPGADGQPSVKPEIQAAILMGAGLLGPQFLGGGKNSQFMKVAGYSVATKGVDILMKKFAPQLIAGTDDIMGVDEDGIANADDEDIAGIGEMDDYVVTGDYEPMSNPEGVASLV